MITAMNWSEFIRMSKFLALSDVSVRIVCSISLLMLEQALCNSFVLYVKQLGQKAHMQLLQKYPTGKWVDNGGI